MALGRLQAAIVDNLSNFKYLSGEATEELKNSEGEYNGSSFDELLLTEYRVSTHQLNLAKAKAYGVTPLNVRRVAINKGTWEALEQEFCEKHGVVPVSVVGKYITVAFSNPFELTISQRIADITGKQVIPVLSPESDIREVLKQDGSQVDEAQFDDVVESLGMEFTDGEDVGDEELDDEDSAPIIQLANRIV